MSAQSSNAPGGGTQVGAATWIENLVLSVHRRNGGSLTALDWKWRLLEPRLSLDSLDLAEIVAGVERQFGSAIFDALQPPKTWRDVLTVVTDRPARTQPGQRVRRSQ